MTGFAQIERQQLSDTLTQTGPLAPTLCAGWLTKDLAAHIVLRERRPDAAVGVVLRSVAEHTARVQTSYAAKAWPALVEMLREGPPGWSPARLPQVDDAVNLAEFFIHHEDVLRADPGWDQANCRRLDEDLRQALWSRVRQMGQLLFRRSPTGVVLVTPSHGRAAVHGPTKLGTVVLRGEPQELLLFAYGRTRVAAVEVDGDPDAVQGFAAGELGV